MKEYHCYTEIPTPINLHLYTDVAIYMASLYWNNMGLLRKNRLYNSIFMSTYINSAHQVYYVLVYIWWYHWQ